MCFPRVGELAEGEMSCMAHQRDTALPYWGFPSFPGVMDVLSLQLDPLAGQGSAALVSSRVTWSSSPWSSTASLPAGAASELRESCRWLRSSELVTLLSSVSCTALAQLSLSRSSACLPCLMCCKEGCSPFQTLKWEQKCVRECSVWIWIKFLWHMDAITFPYDYILLFFPSLMISNTWISDSEQPWFWEMLSFKQRI